MRDDLTMFWRFATGLRRFFQSPLSPEECRRIVESGMQNREQSFLRLLERAVFGFPRSPYLALLRWAGAEYGEIERMVHGDGIEAALERLYDAGVHVSLDEFKGRRPIRRPGFAVETTGGDFDNPLLAREFELASGGSTGPRRRLAIDLDLLTTEGADKHLVLEAHGIARRPFALWRAVPPGSSGIKNALIAAKYGNPLEHWFSPSRLEWRPSSLKSTVFTLYAVYGSLLWGARVPPPEYVPLHGPGPIAEWLAARVRQKTPALLCGPASSIVRVCTTAIERGLDISGTVFRVSGEPFTPAKWRIVQSAGARTCSLWSMSETGSLGGGCANREAIDECHLFLDKVSVFQRSKLLSDGESEVEALYLTTLLPSTPKIMLNVDTGDYGVLSRRRCGCPLEQTGWDLHLHTIRNYEKLTTGGMHFMGSEFITLVEEVLPAAHGGSPGDYQFLEEEQNGISKVCVVISPRVGEINEEAILHTVLSFLTSSSPGGKLMAQEWTDGRILRVVREEPYATAAAKVPALRVLRSTNGSRG